MKIKTEADIEKLKSGDPIEFDFDLTRFDDMEDGPLVLLDSPEWKEIERLTLLIEDKFLSPPKNDNSNNGNGNGNNLRETPSFTVTFNKTHVVVVSLTEQVVNVGGDVRDGEWKLKIGENKRKLSKDASSVTIDGVSYPVK